MYWVRKNIIGGSPIPYTEDEIREWKRNGVKKVLVLPEDWEIEESWGDVNYYFSVLKENGLKYLHVPIPDGYAPTDEQFEKIMKWLNGDGNLVHCVGGIGRTGTVIAAYLIVKEGLNVDEAIEEVRAHKPGAVQTIEQYEFLIRVGKKYGRGLYY